MVLGFIMSKCHSSYVFLKVLLLAILIFSSVHKLRHLLFWPFSPHTVQQKHEPCLILATFGTLSRHGLCGKPCEIHYNHHHHH